VIQDDPLELNHQKGAQQTDKSASSSSSSLLLPAPGASNLYISLMLKPNGENYSRITNIFGFTEREKKKKKPYLVSQNGFRF
jgi:hypothetical protein